MAKLSRPSKRYLMLFSACGLVFSLVPVARSLAQSAATAPGPQLAQATPPSGTPVTPNVSRGASEDIIVRAQRQLLKEKNSPSAVTELGTKAIQATGVSGSSASLLRQAPSVYVYQQGIGDNGPILSIRGARGLEIASTLDGVPTQDLLNGGTGAGYLSNNIGSPFSLDQIDGVSIYPGVAYPNKNTFGTIGGTVAYSTKRPSNDFYIDLIGEVGSFQTYESGITINSGAIDSPLGTGDNAAKVLLQYTNLQSAGYIDYTPSRYNHFEAAFDKPYDDGLSKFQATILYNTGSGLFQNEPVPLPYLNQNGLFSNYPTSVWQDRENNDFLTIILKDDTYINEILSVGLTGFYLHNDNQNDTYAGINYLGPAGAQTPVTVGGSAPFINNPAGFGLGGLFGPGTPNYLPGVYQYNPFAQYPVGSKYCPTSIVKSFAASGLTAPCGINSELTVGHSDTYGIQPRATIIVPEYFGIANTIQIGGLVAKETSPVSANYLGGGPTVAATAANLTADYPVGPLAAFNGGDERTIFQVYGQDKIDLIDNTLHITPGATIEGTFSSLREADVYAFLQGGFVDFKSKKWNREVLPFLNVSYDLDKILPPLKGVQIYGSTGQSALFAPVNDFGPNAAGVPPNASIVHLYEGGVKYNTSDLLVSADYFYQKVDRDFGFFSYQSGPQAGLNDYNDLGQREFKGVEASVVWQVMPPLQLFANGSHLLAKYLQSNFAFATVAEDQYGIDLKGAPVTGIPDWLSTFGADYTRKSNFEDGDAFETRITGVYTGHQSTTYDILGNANVPNFTGLVPAGPIPCTPANATSGHAPPSCTRFSQLSGATVYDPNGGISPFVTFNLDLNYTLPTPQLPMIKNIKFDLNIQNLFNEHYFQYFYKQVSPSACPRTASNPTASQYNCTPEFADGIPGQPFSVFFTVKARF